MARKGLVTGSQEAFGIGQGERRGGLLRTEWTQRKGTWVIGIWRTRDFRLSLKPPKTRRAAWSPSRVSSSVPDD